MSRLLTIGFLGLLILTACTKECKECYFIEEVNGQRTETSIGEKCGDEIESTESQDARCTVNCYYDCQS